MGQWPVGAGCCLSRTALAQGPSGHPRPPSPGPSGRHPHHLLGEPTGLSAGLQGERRGCGWGGGSRRGPSGLLKVRKKCSALLLGMGAPRLSLTRQKDSLPSRDSGWLPWAARGPPGPRNTWGSSWKQLSRTEVQNGIAGCTSIKHPPRLASPGPSGPWEGRGQVQEMSQIH